MTERTRVWGGPWLDLKPTIFSTEKDLNVTFGFDFQSDEKIRGTWQLRISKDGEEKVFKILRY